MSVIPTSLKSFNLQDDPIAYTILNVILMLTYTTMAIYSAFVTIRALRRPDMSSTARQMIIRRHILYIVTNFLCQFYSFFSNITAIYTSLQSTHNPNEYKDSWFMKIFCVFFFG